MAGGSGTRMGASLPKQFIEIKGKAVLQLTIEKFVSAYPGIKVITVLPQEWHQYWKDYCYMHNFIYPQTLVTGGISRFHSVRNGLDHVPDNSLVAVHDGVRPLVSKELICRVFGQADEFGAAVPVIPVVDTLKVIDRVRNEDGESLERAVGEEADRSRLYGAQTPQIFHSEILKHAYGQPFSETFTDDAAVVESCGVRIRYVEGEKFNLKLTTPDDLVIAKALLGA